MSETNELKPCPFCGNTHALKVITAQELAEEGEDDPEPWTHSESWAVICDASRPNGPGGCGASGGYMPTRDEAIAAWNRRAAVPEGWRSIESAPKDGTWQVVAHFDSQYFYWWKRARFHRGGWRTGNGTVIPSHYLPLPAAPNTEESNNG